MKTRIGFLFLLMAVLLVQARLWAQPDTTLLATTDLDCTWKLDGKPQGNLKADDSVVTPISLGKHLIQATSTDGLDKWRTVVTVKQAGQEMVDIKLKEAHERRVAATEPATQPKTEPVPQPKTEPAKQQTARPTTPPTQEPTWTDPATGLMWAGKDNGRNLTWNEADSYCGNLKLAGYSKWRLPTVDEFTGIYDETQNVNESHIKGGIRVTGWEWTNSAANSSGAHRLFTFRSTKKDSVLFVYAKRALCVRRAGE